MMIAVSGGEVNPPSMNLEKAPSQACRRGHVGIEVRVMVLPATSWNAGMPRWMVAARRVIWSSWASLASAPARPCVADRVAQTVVRVDPLFHQDSYSYRPGKSALE